jgi:hypothetical protein
MLKERKAAARQVAATLAPTEQSLDETIAQTAGLNRTLVESGMQIRAGLTIGQTAITCFGDAYMHLLKARACFAAGHVELKNVRTQMGLDAHAVGDSSICPDEAQVFLSEDRKLKIVA